jgi:hypothetical protein
MSIKRSVLLIILFALIASVYASVVNRPDYLSNVFEAPKAGAEEQSEDGDKEPEETKKAPLSETDNLIKAMENAKTEWGENVPASMIVSLKNGASVESDRGSSVQACVMGFLGDTYIMDAPVLTSGRLLYKEELDSGAYAAVLDEQTAVKLFRTGEPIDRFLTINDAKFRVVGVIKHSRSVGENDELRISVPLKALDKSGFQSDIYAINLKTAKGQGAQGQIKNSLESLSPKGTLYNISKEKHRSLLPVRWGIGYIAILILSIFKKMLAAFSKLQFEKERAKLSDKYFQDLLIIWVIKAALVLAMWLCWLYAVYMVLQFMVEPVYIFPEWVPATLVEWSDINTAFWNNRQSVTNLIEMRIPSILELQFYHRILTALCISFAALLLKPYYKIKQKFE